MFMRNRFVREYDSKHKVEVQHIQWENSIFNTRSLKEKTTFKFLNIEHTFDKIDWNYDGWGKLWTYNLNYFDFLLQEGCWQGTKVLIPDAGFYQE